MLRIPTTEARKRFAELVTGAAYQGRRVLLTHYGKAIAALVPISDVGDAEPAPAQPPPRRPARDRR
jgi:prevent-host-death family protein